jgi:hypothetical protein
LREDLSERLRDGGNALKEKAPPFRGPSSVDSNFAVINIGL